VGHDGGNPKSPAEVTLDRHLYHDDNTLVHDFFYMMNDDRNDGGDGTSPRRRGTRTTPNAYGTTTSTSISARRTSDRDFSSGSRRPGGSFGEAHVYYWARKAMLWQKRALVDEGVLTLGNFNNPKGAGCRQCLRR
jgi:hypothetical protein